MLFAQMTTDLPATALNRSDWIDLINNFVPAKYQHLALLVFGAACVAGRVYLAYQKGHGAIIGGAKAIVLGDSGPPKINYPVQVYETHR